MIECLRFRTHSETSNPKLAEAPASNSLTRTAAPASDPKGAGPKTSPSSRVAMTRGPDLFGRPLVRIVSEITWCSFSVGRPHRPSNVTE